eukprot:g8149.t1
MPTTGPVMTKLAAGTPGGAGNRMAKTKSQLKREERVSIFGLDCADSVVISGWQVGKEVQKTITIKNVSLTTQKLNYELPKNEAFQLEYPKGWALAPGTSVTIRLFFRPILYEPHLDYVTVKTPTGQFSVLLKAVVTELALSIPPFVDFGYSPVQETVVIPLPMHNTGSLPLRYEWGFASPFLIPRSLGEGVIPVNQMVELEIEFRPPEAKTYEGVLRVKISTIRGEAGEEEGGEVAGARTSSIPRTKEAVQDMKFYELRVIGAGKVPHLIAVVPNNAESRVVVSKMGSGSGGSSSSSSSCQSASARTLVEFAPLLPTQSSRQAVVVQNVSLVRANFLLRPVADEVPPLSPMYFPERGSIEPGQKGELEFRFGGGGVVGETVSRDFEVVTPGGAPLRVTVRGSVCAAEVAFSCKSINFGELDCSQDPAKVYERAMLKQQGKDPGVKILRLDNRGPMQVNYHFVNATQLYSVFTFDKPSGVIAPHGYVLITLNFAPLAPINYYKRFYCVFKNGPLEAVPLDLVGTGYTDEQRPAVLQVDNVTDWHKMRQLGFPEYDSRPSSPARSEAGAPDVAGEHASPRPGGPTLAFAKGTPGREEQDGEHGSPVRSVSPKKTYQNFLDRVFPATLKRSNLTNTQSFLECLYPPRDIALTPNELDFMQGAGQRTVVVTNSTSQKVIAVWMVVNETRGVCSLHKFDEVDNSQTFSVYPHTAEIPAGGEFEFTVAYRPPKPMNFDGDVLECFVFPKRNRSFHLVNLKKFTPPTCLNLRCQGHTMGLHRDDCQVEISDSGKAAVRMKPCALMQRSYHVFLIRNHGDTKMVYKVLPPLAEDNSLPTDPGSETPFRCYPTRGCIYPHSFHAVVIEFAPTRVQNQVEFRARIPIVVNYEEANYRYVHVHARCWQTKLNIKENLLTFPLTCQGTRSQLALQLRNETEIPIAYDVRIPARFKSVFHVEESEGRVGPSERADVCLRFTPEGEGLFSTAINVHAFEERCAEDDRRIFAIQDRDFFGPHEAIEDVAGRTSFFADEAAHPHPLAKKVYAVQLVGHGQQPALTLERDCVDLGVLTAGHPEATKSHVRIHNSANQEVFFKVELEFEFEKLDLDKSPLKRSIEQMRSPKGSHRDGASDRYSYPASPGPPKDPPERAEEREQLFKGSLQFACTEGRIGPRGFFDLQFEVSPKRRGIHQWNVRVVPVATHHPLPSGPAGEAKDLLEVGFSVRADAQAPLVQISDVRQESAVSQPVSMLWTYCQVDDFNQGQRRRPSNIDRSFQSALGFDQRRKLLPKLGSYQLNFGTAPYGNQPTVVYLLRDVPLWHDEIPPWHRGQSVAVSKSSKNNNREHEDADVPSVEEQRLIMAEHHYEWVENHKVLDVYPKSSTIAPGEFQFVRFTYQHFSVGTHILPFVLNVWRGKSMVFYCKANTLPPNIGRLSVRANAITLRPVPIGYEKGPLQVIELSNCGSAPACWQLNRESLDDLQEREGYGFPLLTVHPVSGVLEPKSRIFLHCHFTPIEEKRIRCPIKIDLTLRGDGSSETLDFELCAHGFDPQKLGNNPPPLGYLTPPFGPTLPLQTYAPLPNYGAALSCEAVDFGVVLMPIFSTSFGTKIQRFVNTKIVALVNYSKDSVLAFHWRTQGLFRNSEEFSITPESGTLYPGTHQIILFRLHCIEGPLELVGDLECQISWELLHPAPPPGPDPWERADGAENEEVFAAHAENIHEPTYDPGNFANRHVSVVNRLTVARFRALMSTAAGQKYLNRSLDRTALLSSHISNLTPRRAYKKLEQNFLRTREQETKTDELDRENLGFSQLLSEIDQSQLLSEGAAGAGGATASPPSIALASFPLFVRLSVACRAEETSDFAMALAREKHLVAVSEPSIPLTGASRAASSSSRPPSMVIEDAPPRGAGESRSGSGATTSKQLHAGVLPDGTGKSDFDQVCGTVVEGMRLFLKGGEFKQLLEWHLSERTPYLAQLDPTTGVRGKLSEGLRALRPRQRTDPLESPAPEDLLRLREVEAGAAVAAGEHEHVETEGESKSSSTSSALMLDFPARAAQNLFDDASLEEDAALHPPAMKDEHEGGRGPGPQSKILWAEEYWTDTVRQYGQLQLENFFTNCASHVLEHTVLRVTDETISGQGNWAKLHLDKR